MNPLNSVSNSIKPIDLSKPNRLTKHKPEVRYYCLESYHLLPDANEAICKVRNLLTEALRQVLASRLEPVSYDENSYLLEFVKTNHNSGRGVQR